MLLKLVAIYYVSSSTMVDTTNYYHIQKKTNNEEHDNHKLSLFAIDSKLPPCSWSTRHSLSQTLYLCDNYNAALYCYCSQGFNWKNLIMQTISSRKKNFIYSMCTLNKSVINKWTIKYWIFQSWTVLEYWHLIESSTNRHLVCMSKIDWFSNQNE